MGKICDDGTEVISMGLGEMAENPLRLYRKDKEHLALILRVMWGAL